MPLLKHLALGFWSAAVSTFFLSSGRGTWMDVPHADASTEPAAASCNQVVSIPKNNIALRQIAQHMYVNRKVCPALELCSTAMPTAKA